MHAPMSGWYEVRIDGPKPGGGRGRHHYRLFCLIDLAAKGRAKPLLVVVTGMMKPIGTTLSDADYAAVRRLSAEYLARNPRSVG